MELKKYNNITWEAIGDTSSRTRSFADAFCHELSFSAGNLLPKLKIQMANLFDSIWSLKHHKCKTVTWGAIGDTNSSTRSFADAFCHEWSFSSGENLHWTIVS